MSLVYYFFWDTVYTHTSTCSMFVSTIKQEALPLQRGRAMLRVCQLLASIVDYVKCNLLLLVP